ncbi:hypothetical protein B4U37_01700 [Sutcliffiella horikoshii]|uniref:Uncharacterized protein n=1 Tax=Sutcliffiella horikoshii TaxID=79883 RepID=A0ABM6KEC4_9BACI|nr:hypothetical protein [Sutcliffiella horikoshii]ART74839.1 hypothetical protein B4U37_01700 [Sutcliffiella horikoshii]
MSDSHDSFTEAVEKLKKVARELEPTNEENNEWCNLVSEMGNLDVAPELVLKMKPQLLHYDIISKYLPHKWEMPRDGRLLYSDRELLEALKLIIFNSGVKNTLDLIPRELIEAYLHKKENSTK